MPCGVSGRFARKSQVDRFAFAARKGEKFVVAAQTGEVLSPAEAYLIVRDPKGVEIGKSDPNRAAASVEFTAARVAR